MKLIRYEIQLTDNETKGIFNAPFDRNRINEEEMDTYYEMLNELPCPEIEKSVFYFTEKGYQKFCELVSICQKALPKCLQNKNIEIRIEVDKNCTDILYQDKWQVALIKK
jgi:hypothetical protein